MPPVIVNSPVAILLQYCNIQANSARVLKKKRKKANVRQSYRSPFIACVCCMDNIW